MRRNYLVSRACFALQKYLDIQAEHRPNSYRCTNSIRKALRLRPTIPYIEVHLADHCNLNCRGCSHFSPIADRIYADITQYARDMKRLSWLVSNVRKIRLLGGEPLLHPNITIFISITRKYFPYSDIQIVSNGILLPTMREEFWQTCQKNRVTIELNIAPPFYGKQQSWAALVKNYKLKAYVHRKVAFIDFIDTKGSSKEEENFKRCRKRFACYPLLKEGRIYNCFIPANVHYYNNKYGTQIPSAEYIKIHDPHIDGWDLLRRITNSTQTCRYCTGGWKKVPWFPWSAR